MELLRGIFGMVLTFGLVAVLLTLLNRRDGHAIRLRRTVFEQVALPELYGRVAVYVWCPLLARRSMVTVDLLAAMPHEVWSVFTRLASCLPPHVRLVVHSTVNQELMRPVTFETTTGRLTADDPYMPRVIG